MAKQTKQHAKKSSSKRLKLSAMMLIIALPLMAALIVSLVVSAMQLEKVKTESEQIYYEYLHSLSSDILNADRDLYQAIYGATQYNDNIALDAVQSTPELKEMITSKLDEYTENKDQVKERMAEAVELAKKDPTLWTGTTVEGSDATFESLYSKFETAVADWETCYDIENAALDAKNKGIDNGSAFEEFNNKFEIAREDLSEMANIVDTWAVKEKSTLDASIDRSIMILVIIFAVVIAILAVVVIITIRNVSKAVKKVEAEISVLAGGDFATVIAPSSSIRDFFIIATHLEGMREKLQKSMLQIIEHADHVNAKSDGTAESVETSRQMTGDIDQAVEDLANGSTQMAQDVQGTSDIVVEMGDATDNVINSAESNMEMGEKLYEGSVNVQKQLTDLKEADQLMADKAQEISDSVENTANMVEKISAAADGIIAIASQTNLLSLNASIEAARAGEAGKGFAVVADEIQGLADQSDKTAKEITDMLSDIIKLSNANKNLTADIQEAIDKESSEMQNMIESFDEMLQMLEATQAGNKNILELAKVLGDNKESIINAVESLSAISEENAASTQQSSASIQQLDENMGDILEEAENLKGIAEELKQEIGFFKV